MARVVKWAATMAVAAIVTNSLPAAAAPTVPCWLAKAPAIREPQPIAVDQAVTDRASATLTSVAQGTFDRSQLEPSLQTATAAKFFQLGATLVSALGPVQSMFAFEQRTLANETSTYFRVRFSNETLTWVLSVDAQNQIVGLSLRRTEACKIFNIAEHDIQY